MGAVAPERVLVEERSVLLHCRSTPASVHGDGIKASALKGGNIDASERPCGFGISRVQVQRAATRGTRDVDHRVAILA